MPELEADDLVSVYHDPMKTVICSPDKDVLQQLAGTHFNKILERRYRYMEIEKKNISFSITWNFKCINIASSFT